MKCFRSAVLIVMGVVMGALMGAAQTGIEDPIKELLPPPAEPTSTNADLPSPDDDEASNETKNVCSLPPLLPEFENKTCLEPSAKYTYDPLIGKCTQYTYSGCGRSQNLFDTENECKRICMRKRVDEPSADDCLLVCPSKFDPLCASNNVTYANDCEMRAAACREKMNLTVQYAAVCGEKPTISPQSDTPIVSLENNVSRNISRVCTLPPLVPGFDRTCFAALPRWTFDVTIGTCVGYTYGGCGGSENLFRTEEQCKALCPDYPGVSSDAIGNTKLPKQCPNVCPALEDPVCGSNGMTFPNACILEVTACSKNQDIKLLHFGPCADQPSGFPLLVIPCPVGCLPVREPVCGSDNQTYSNLCEMHVQSCGANSNNITVQHEGPCASNATVIAPKDRKPACDLPIYTGPCHISAFRKWGFHKETGRCEWFFYGGCLGNDNRFDTPYDCQMSCGGSEPLTDFACDQRKCTWKIWAHYIALGCKPVYENGKCCPARFDCNFACDQRKCTWKIWAHYIALGCKPVYENGKCCPARFDCSEFETRNQQDNPECIYKGEAYQIGEAIPGVKEHDPCFHNCVCKLHPDYRNIADIHCEQAECTLFHGALDIFEKSCRKIYQRGKCCPSSINCGIPILPHK
ncbi:unnamed protein product [Notodromas monacha]|uniref:Uncharacterized protein n=1 Tax=Notodromas monacha TaxID=399045 RepID=A0A7R9G7J8_9CRUS|nr:unnamed protein product [Notodromas monacha]CAG0912305.1 unnamed protein product [Notodromas monacha]